MDLTPIGKEGTRFVSNRHALPFAKRRQEGRILNALVLVAQLLEHDEAYLPVFLRLEAELQTAKTQQAALQRAKAFVQERR